MFDPSALARALQAYGLNGSSGALSAANSGITAATNAALPQATDLKPGLAALRSALTPVWKASIPCHLREPLWLAAAGALPGQQFRPWRCPCGCQIAHASSALPATRIFWDCLVAQAVVAPIAAAVAPVPLLPCHIMLLLPPVTEPPLCPCAWQIIALNAIHAIEGGRAGLWTAAHESPGPPALPVDVPSVATAAVASFWSSLARLVASSGAPPASWSLHAEHPILAVEGGVLVLRAGPSPAPQAPSPG